MIDLRNYIAHVILRDGTSVSIRTIHRDDSGRVLRAFARLGRDSIYTRFFSHKRVLTDADLRQITDVDFDRVVALVVTTGVGDDETIVGGGRYIADDGPRPGRSAEVAFTIDDDYQGRGIARLLLGHLVQIARENGVSWLEADVLAENQPMLTVFRRSGLPVHQRSDGSVIHVTLSLVGVETQSLPR
jgi:GNAT superfamily N-acetyltransferase